MPFLGHIIAPQLNQELEKIRAQVGSAGNVKAPAQAASAQPKTLMDVFRNAAIASAMTEDKMQKHTHLIPNAPVQQPPLQVDSHGRPMAIPMQHSAPVAVDEAGRSVDSYGKKLGYLQQPAVVTPYGDMPMRQGDMTVADVAAQPPALANRFVQPGNTFVPNALEQLYGADRAAMEGNRDANGMPTDQFPAGYLKGKSKEEGAKRKQGVKVLQQNDKPTDT